MDVKNKEIILVGTGKVAFHLGNHLRQKGFVNTKIWGRNPEKTEAVANSLSLPIIKDFSSATSNALFIVCVADSAIEEVLQQIPDNYKVCYTSGSVQLQQLPQRQNLGVFYPLQSFSPNREMNLTKVPFLIEATRPEFGQELFELAENFSETVLFADSAFRYQLHIAAVMVNNFSNFIFHLAQQHLAKHQIDFNLLRPLIQETIDKLEVLTPLEAQTGPAARGDQMIIQKHLHSIDDPKTKELYALMSTFIEQEMKQKNEL